MNPQSFTVEYENIVPQLLTECGVCEAYLPAPGKEPPKVHSFKALWDTGASITTISKKVVAALGLTPIGFGDVSHAGGTAKAGVYILNIILPNGLLSPPMRVLDGILGDFDVLIGMDIISNGDFAVTHSDGKTTFTFRLPSVEKIDFVDSTPKSSTSTPAPMPKQKEPGRNDPCPCGSGKKYKKCCGK